MASFTKQVNPWLAKHPLKTNGRLANLELTSIIKEAIVHGFASVFFRNNIRDRMNSSPLQSIHHPLFISCYSRKWSFLQGPIFAALRVIWSRWAPKYERTWLVGTSSVGEYSTVLSVSHEMGRWSCYVLYFCGCIVRVGWTYVIHLSTCFRVTALVLRFVVQLLHSVTLMNR